MYCKIKFPWAFYNLMGTKSLYKVSTHCRHKPRVAFFPITFTSMKLCLPLGGAVEGHVVAVQAKKAMCALKVYRNRTSTG